jgi:hypothetical protein
LRYKFSSAAASRQDLEGEGRICQAEDVVAILLIFESENLNEKVCLKNYEREGLDRLYTLPYLSLPNAVEPNNSGNNSLD